MTTVYNLCSNLIKNDFLKILFFVFGYVFGLNKYVIMLIIPIGGFRTINCKVLIQIH